MNKIFGLSNVGRGPLTTGLGVLVILAALASVFTHKSTWAEAAVGMGIGLALLGLKDPTTGAGTGAVGVVSVLTLLALGGCAGSRGAATAHGSPTPPTVVAIRDTLRLPVALRTQADSLSGGFWLDSLANAGSGKVVKLVSKGGQATVKVWKSPRTKAGGDQRLHFRVDVPARVIRDTITRVVTVYGECPPAYTIKAAPTLWQRWVSHYRNFCTALVSIGLVVLLIVLLFKYRPWRLLGVVLVLGLASSGVGLAACRTQPHAPPYRFAPHQPSYLPAKLPRPVHRPH